MMGNELPKDGVAFGRLLVKGPTIVERYFKSNESSLDKNGWFDTGDVAKIHPEGSMEIVDRSKDVIKSGGEWISSIDLENAAVGHPAVAEAAVVGFPHDIKGQGIYTYVTLMAGIIETDSILSEIKLKVRELIGPHASPDKIQFTPALPKTRSGKIMRRILRKIAEGDTNNMGDISTLADPGVVDNLVEGMK